MISSLNPITRRYRTDLLLQRLNRTKCSFYTDVLFVKEKYIVGNKYTQIFTDGEFEQIFPMRYESEAETTLDMGPSNPKPKII